MNNYLKVLFPAFDYATVSPSHSTMNFLLEQKMYEASVLPDDLRNILRKR